MSVERCDICGDRGTKVNGKYKTNGYYIPINCVCKEHEKQLVKQ